MSESAADAPSRGTIADVSASNRWRYAKDAAARYTVFGGGLGVIAALLLIFVYLLSEVSPLFSGADVHARQTYTLPGGPGATLHVAAEEQGEVGLRVLASGEVVFFDLFTGALRETLALPLAGRTISALADVAPERALLAAGLSDGTVLLVQHQYRVTYPGDKRLITPQLAYPYGQAPLAFLAEAGRNLTVRDNDGKILLAATDVHNTVHLKAYESSTNFLGESTFAAGGESAFTPPVSADLLLIDPLLDWLYVIDKVQGRLAFYKLKGADAPELLETAEIGAAVEQAQFLAGGISVVMAQANGRISQWFPARNADGEFRIARVRDFELAEKGVVTAVAAEHRRRGFAAGDENGHVSLFYSTSGRRLFDEKLLDAPVELLAFNPRAKLLIAVGRDGGARTFDIENEHPEISFSALWKKVWYESYDEPRYLWQSSSASSDFEPKFSMTPLAMGTLKGAFYAMIFAIPLAVLGAIFTAYFMSSEMRQVVKPAVEVLAALPSVILGFLAGLWLAPYVELNLLGTFLALILLPLSIPVFGYIWLKLPVKLRQATPAGWEAALLIPVIGFVVWLCFAVARPIETMAFGGNLQAWLDHTLGIGYQQRNALVVGIAMGIAVVPVIFSIAEDAIFSVPKHLTLGSLALGATSWQTLMGVVMPTASPGIFSAVMIGMGRAVGETMIVLMATGNTPVTDMNLFTGMRTLAANVAVEMPESEVGSTHFRMLFVAGLVLFIFTFFLNTLAEVVRQRLRSKYSSI
jgi:phosphate transport system permease protein